MVSGEIIGVGLRAFLAERNEKGAAKKPQSVFPSDIAYGQLRQSSTKEFSPVGTRAVREPFSPGNNEVIAMKTALKIAPLFLAATILSACGTSPGDRGLSGAGMGAAVGIIGGPPGMVIGAAVGAGAGMVTSPRQVNLGPPPWEG